MLVHNFHTTFALVPARLDQTAFEVASLFRTYPDKFSLVQLGNNSDGYEFYKYSLNKDDPKDNFDMRARPLSEQEVDITEGLARLEKFSRSFNQVFEKVMIFPRGISPEPTLRLLKKYNYLATVNAEDIPLDAVRPLNWDYGMNPAIMDYGNFPVLVRRNLDADQLNRQDIQPLIFDLFIDKPALYYSNAFENGLFATGINAFNPIADKINNLPGDVEWRSLGYILTHLYLEKIDDDGSSSVRMFTNQLSLTNEAGIDMSYHISKSETLNIPIASVTVNGRIFPYSIRDGLLTLDVKIPAIESINVFIQYEE